MAKIRNRKGLRQISFDVPEEYLQHIKKHISEMDITMKKWIMEAMDTKFLVDKHFGWE